MATRKTWIGVLFGCALLYLAAVLFVCTCLPGNGPSDVQADEPVESMTVAAEVPVAAPDEAVINTSAPAHEKEPGRLLLAGTPVAEGPNPVDGGHVQNPQTGAAEAHLLPPEPVPEGAVAGCVAVGADSWQRTLVVVHRPDSEPEATPEPPAAAPSAEPARELIPPPAEEVPGEADLLWLRAQTAEQGGDFATARSLYRQLSQQTDDRPLAIRSYNRLRVLEETKQESALSGPARNGVGERLVPRPVCTEAVLAQPLPPSRKPMALARRLPLPLPLTGTHHGTLDSQRRLVLPRGAGRQLGEPLPRTLFLTAGPDACLWLCTPRALERLAGPTEHSPGDGSAAHVFRRLYFAHTESAPVDRDGGIVISECLAQFAGLEREVVVIGVHDHFEIWDALRWEQYLAQHVPAARKPVRETTQMAASSSDPKPYRVRGEEGETFRDVARRILGDPERWPEVYRLNPGFDPNQPVPAGSWLHLPAEGRGD
jgi:MraZ protein